MVAGDAVIFDLDNTLHDRDRGVVDFLQAQYRRHAVELGSISLTDWVARFVLLERGGKIWKDVVYQQLAEEFSFDIPPKQLLLEYETEFCSHVIPYSGLQETLRSLKGEGWRLGIVTNGRSEFQRRTISALHIEQFLDVIVVSAECGLRKPDPAIFQRALHELDCHATDSWFVGDDPDADVKGATDAGMQAIHFNPKVPMRQESGRFSVNRLNQVPLIVNR